MGVPALRTKIFHHRGHRAQRNSDSSTFLLKPCANQRRLPRTTVGGFDRGKCGRNQCRRGFSKPRPILRESRLRRSTNCRRSTMVRRRRAHGGADAIGAQNGVSLDQVLPRFRGRGEKSAERLRKKEYAVGESRGPSTPQI